MNCGAPEATPLELVGLEKMLGAYILPLGGRGRGGEDNGRVRGEK